MTGGFRVRSVVRARGWVRVRDRLGVGWGRLWARVMGGVRVRGWVKVRGEFRVMGGVRSRSGLFLFIYFLFFFILFIYFF